MARILVAEDDPQMQLAIAACLERSGYELAVVGNGRLASERLEKEFFDLIISDQRMPEVTGSELLEMIVSKKMNIPFIMITAYGTINQAVQAMQLGAADFITKPFAAEDLERVVERILSPELKSFRNNQRKKEKGRAIITNDPIMIRILEVTEAVARSDATVLIQGESGTGKELVARMIHASSPRASQQLVAVNCAALPSNLLESELFGHEKGSFTGALNRKIGKFELAQGGTILLDEISEMELSLQAKLLRVLQEREIDRVGGGSPIGIDVRVVATTNRNLEEEVRSGRFRSDLFYRLNVIPITLPPLRSRRGDIKLLIEHFMRQYIGRVAPALGPSVLDELESYSWPGNIRELQNAVERAAILSQGKMPVASDFLLTGSNQTPLSQLVEVERTESENKSTDSTVIKSGLTVAQMERALILETLRSTGNNRTRAAELLGISIRTLRNKLAEYRAEE